MEGNEEQPKEKPSLREMLDVLTGDYQRLKDLEKTKKVRKFIFPWKGRVNKARLKKNWASICYINDNRAVSFLKAPIQEGVIYIDDIPHVATADYTLNYKGKPFLIVPSWNQQPFSPIEDMNEAVAKARTTHGYHLIANTLESTQIKQKASMKWGIIVVGIIVLLGAGYYMLKGGF